MVAHEKRNPAQLFCAVPTQNDLALSSLLFSDHPTQKLEYPALGNKKEKMPETTAVSGILQVRLHTGSFTREAKKALNGSSQTLRKNTRCVIHNTEAWLRSQTG